MGLDVLADGRQSLSIPTILTADHNHTIHFLRDLDGLHLTNRCGMTDGIEDP
jgi:hypothetical protein